MLLKYSVCNFKSIGNNIEFSMLPLEDSNDDRFLTEIDTVIGKWKILKRGVFFGPNASGKTSFVDSFSYARNYVVKGPKNNSVKKINQFRGDIKELEELTTFQFLIYIDGDIYNYGFSLDRKCVHDEWLAILKSNNRFSLLFDRSISEDGEVKIEVFDEYAEEDNVDRELAELLTNSIREKQADQLYLFKLYENSSKIVEPIYLWFKRVQIIYPDTKIRMLPFKIKLDEDLREFLSEKLKALDTGVNNVSIIQDNIDLSEFEERFDIPNEIIHEIEEIQNGVITLNGKTFIFKEGKKSRIDLIQIKFEHILNNKKINFDIEDESDGTRRLLDLLPILFKLDNDSHMIYIIDELDRSLHTKLSRYLVNSFAEADSTAQLLFTTHDVNLLNLDNFRKEEIWFIEKNSNGETRLKPFSDFITMPEQSVFIDYLAGRFGAIPYIKEDE